MPTINQLSAASNLSASDLIALFSTANGDARKASLTVLAEFLQTLITASDDKVTQYALPSVSGFTVQVDDSSNSVWLILTPTGGFSSGTVKLPAVANCVDKQEVLVNSTQSVNIFAVNGNGANVIGAPSTLAANGYFRLRFDAVTKTWYRVG